ncbi:MAG TPA: hypothetical protein VK436_09910 [Methanocella sp.]|nr:hypothetical protein [Methanocella sp.]
MERIYYRFPSQVDLDRNYGYSADTRYLVKAMAGINGKIGATDFDTDGPSIKSRVNTVKAKCELLIEIAARRVDFLPLTQQNLASVLPGLEPGGTIDFRFTVKYSYLDEHFNRMSLKSDVFLVRATVDGKLNLRVANMDGQERTMPEEIANTIEAQLKRFKG